MTARRPSICLFALAIGGGAVACGSHEHKPRPMPEAICAGSASAPDDAVVLHFAEPKVLDEAGRLTQEIQRADLHGAPSSATDDNARALSALGRFTVDARARANSSSALREHLDRLPADLDALDHALTPMIAARDGTAPLLEAFGDVRALNRAAERMAIGATTAPAWRAFREIDSETEFQREVESGHVSADLLAAITPREPNAPHVVADVRAVVSAASEQGDADLAAVARVFLACTLVDARLGLIDSHVEPYVQIEPPSIPDASRVTAWMTQGDRVAPQDLILCGAFPTLPSGVDPKALLTARAQIDRLCNTFRPGLDMSSELDFHPGKPSQPLPPLNTGEAKEALAAARKVIGGR
jgi:hypothetical protein